MFPKVQDNHLPLLVIQNKVLRSNSVIVIDDELVVIESVARYASNLARLEISSSNVCGWRRRCTE